MSSENNDRASTVYNIPLESENNVISKTNDAPKNGVSSPKAKDDPTIGILTNTASKFWHIDHEMLRFKLHYFLWIGAMGAVLPYIVVFAKNRIGISASSLGAVLTTQNFLFIFSKPLMGYLADYFNKLKVMILILTMVTIVPFFILLAIPKIDTGRKDLYLSCYVLNSTICDNYRDKNGTNVQELTDLSDCNSVFSIQDCDTVCCATKNALDGNVSNTERVDWIKDDRTFNLFTEVEIDSNVTNKSNFGNNTCFCNRRSDKSRFLRTSSDEVDNLNSLPNSTFSPFLSQVDVDNLNLLQYSTDSEENTNDFATYQFWVFGILFTISTLSSNAIFTLSDTACFESLQKTGAEFGKQRLYGNVGWGLIAPLSGYLNDYTHDYIASWSLMSAMLVLFLWNMSKLNLVKPHYSQNIIKDVGTVFSSKEFLAFEFLVLINGLGTGLIWFYLIWFLTSIGGSKLLCGLALAVQSFVGCLPMMFFSGLILKKVSHFTVLSLALLFYIVRFSWYSQLYNPWFVLPVEFTHGITYGLYYATLASYGKKSAKPGTEATTQSIIFSTHEGLGSGIGCILAGISFDYIGGHKTFLYWSIFYAGALVVSLLINLLVIRGQRGQMRINPTENT